MATPLSNILNTFKLQRIEPLDSRFAQFFLICSLFYAKCILKLLFKSVMLFVISLRVFVYFLYRTFNLRRYLVSPLVPCLRGPIGKTQRYFLQTGTQFGPCNPQQDCRFFLSSSNATYQLFLYLP